jgi:hypothetical protein
LTAGDSVGLLAWLERQGAQRDVLDGLSSCAESWETLWRECPRGDWLLGIAWRVGVARESLVRAAVAAARTCPEEARTPLADAVLQVAERFARGEASEREVAAATAELEAAMGTVGDPVVEATMRAAYAAGEGVADPGVLAVAAAAATEATMVSVMDCALDVAMGWAHAKCAEAVRAHVTQGELLLAAAKAGAQ